MLALVDAAEGDMASRLAAAARQAAAEAREEVSPARLIAAALERLLCRADLAWAFVPSPGRQVLVERDFCDGAGRLFRMDRVIVDPDGVAVIDFKTGAEDPAMNELQIRGYRDILSVVYPGKPVRAILAYIDQGTVRSVE
jgi:hypothetical protein